MKVLSMIPAKQIIEGFIEVFTDVGKE